MLLRNEMAKVFNVTLVYLVTHTGTRVSPQSTHSHCDSSICLYSQLFTLGSHLVAFRNKKLSHHMAQKCPLKALKQP